MADKNEKQMKKQAKHQKKLAKGEIKRQKRQGKLAESPTQDSMPPAKMESRLVIFAQSVRGLLFMITGVSILVAIVLADKGYIVSLEDIFDSFVAARAGKAVLAIVSVAFFILGLKNVRAIK